MSTKKQIFGLCKFYSVYEEIPEESFDWTDVDSFFYHNILDLSQSHHRLVRVSKGSKKTLLISKCFSFAIQKRNWVSSRHFGRVSQSSWSNQQTIADSITSLAEISDWIYKSKRRTAQSLLQGYSWAFEQTNSIFVLVWKEQDLLLFRPKFEHYGDQCILTWVVNLGYREIKHLYKIQFFVAYKCDIFDNKYDIWRQNERKLFPANHSHPLQK